jgi:hypothetical protein
VDILESKNKVFTVDMQPINVQQFKPFGVG